MEEIIKGIGVIGSRGVIVTHMHALARNKEKYNQYVGNKAAVDTLVINDKNDNNDNSKYKITRKEPDGISYAKEIAQRYGLCVEDIIKRR